MSKLCIWRRSRLFYIIFLDLLFLLLSVVVVIMSITKDMIIIIVVVIVIVDNFLLLRSKPDFINRHIIELLHWFNKRVKGRVGIELIPQRCKYRSEVLLNWWLGWIRREMLYTRNFVNRDSNRLNGIDICYLFFLLLRLIIYHNWLINDNVTIRIIRLLKSGQKLWLFL